MRTTRCATSLSQARTAIRAHTQARLGAFAQRRSYLVGIKRGRAGQRSTGGHASREIGRGHVRIRPRAWCDSGVVPRHRRQGTLTLPCPTCLQRKQMFVKFWSAASGSFDEAGWREIPPPHVPLSPPPIPSGRTGCPSRVCVIPCYMSLALRRSGARSGGVCQPHDCHDVFDRWHGRSLRRLAAKAADAFAPVQREEPRQGVALLPGFPGPRRPSL